MNFDDLKLEQVVLQLNYDLGHLYWDKSGEIINEICKAYPEWAWKEPGRGGTVMQNQKHKDISLLFGWETIKFVQHEVENLNQFKKYCREIPRIITRCLSVKEYRRIGNRFWYIQRVEDQENGQKNLIKSGLLEVDERKVKLFGDRIKARSFTIVFEKEDFDIRLSVDVFKRDDIPESLKIDEKFHPRHMIRYDIDVHTDNNLRVDNFDCGEFIQKNRNLIANKLTEFFKS